ncbi:hypothetical protein [Micromonospora sp. NPDC005305]|uniref:hypothetical protein n=1 Tax=Micromonospora sp. NPDC005305 TaxID=3156875 RepID=UPI0033BEC1C7
MGSLRWLLASLGLGAAFGTVTSASNDVSSPYGTFGSQTAQTGWADVAKVASLLLDAGWAWAALAVAAGWLVGARFRGAVAGVVALAAAVTAYYGLDFILRGEPFALYQAEMLWWWVASLVLGSALGTVGAAVRCPGVIGLIAGLAVPMGAALQMVILPPGLDGYTENPEAVWVRLIVWVGAALCGGVVIARFFLAKAFQQPAGGAHTSADSTLISAT